jgi:hypothetical protein
LSPDLQGHSCDQSVGDDKMHTDHLHYSLLILVHNKLYDLMT